MPDNRRTFLKCLGTLGAAGILLPDEALAFGSGRAQVVCPPVFCEPVHIIPVPYTTVTGFHVSYPYPQGADPGSATEIRGNGAFCSWGTYNPNATPQILGVI